MKHTKSLKRCDLKRTFWGSPLRPKMHVNSDIKKKLYEQTVLFLPSLSLEIATYYPVKNIKGYYTLNGTSVIKFDRSEQAEIGSVILLFRF